MASMSGPRWFACACAGVTLDTAHRKSIEQMALTNGNLAGW
ncbi:MAG: hypothetical protein ABI171_20135 [Collimonas sp.]